MGFETLMGDEAIALGAIHAGLSAAFAYPGTPSTEIMEYYQDHARDGDAHFVAQWCTNEKTAYESALGASFAGRRASVSMKHVGLNVAMDPFVNSALLHIKGGLLVVVADDPGMHSSQDEQDSRCLAEFARVPCLEPADQQEAYDMTREAFELSERLRVPVMLRITTRLAHSRAGVETAPARAQNPVSKTEDRWGWTLMPHAARGLWKETLSTYETLRKEFDGAALREAGSGDLAVITTGLAPRVLPRERGRVRGEARREAGPPPYRPLSHALWRVARNRRRGQEPSSSSRRARPSSSAIFAASCPRAFGSRARRAARSRPRASSRRTISGPPSASPPARARPARTSTYPSAPPQLCQGCPHADSYAFLKEALADYPPPLGQLRHRLLYPRRHAALRRHRFLRGHGRLHRHGARRRRGWPHAGRGRHRRLDLLPFGPLQSHRRRPPTGAMSPSSFSTTRRRA